MVKKHKEAWAARCWYWKFGVNRDGDEDLTLVQHEVWCGAPNKALAHKAGQRIAAHPDATSPGLYDVMRGTPDPMSYDGYNWRVVEEVRP